MKHLKKILSLTLALAMVVIMIPATSNVAEAAGSVTIGSALISGCCILFGSPLE